MEEEKFGYITSQGHEIAYMAIGGSRHDLLLPPPLTPGASPT